MLAELSAHEQLTALTWGVIAVFAVGYLLWRLFWWLVTPRTRKQNEQLVRRVQASWPHLTANLGLCYADETTRGRVDLFTGRPARPRLVQPNMHASTDEHGVLVRAATLPGVGLEEYQRAAPHLANAWAVARVEASQSEPGSVLLRGLLSDPLVEPWPVTLTGQVTESRWLLLIGRDRFGAEVALDLPDLAGVKVAGAPGYGKSNLGLSLFAQLAPRPEVQFVIFDGKTSNVAHGDWGDTLPRVALAVGDDPAEANRALRRLVALLKHRPGELRSAHGTNRFWTVGPTQRVPLLVVVIDESHNYTDTAGLRGEEKQLVEDNQRLLRTLVKEGRGCGLLPVVMTQKQTADAIPTSARDNLEVGLCFATTTIEAAAAALGPGIRDDPDNSPIALLDKHRYQGVCVATGLPGRLGYTRLRVPMIDPGEAARLARHTTGLRADLGDHDDGTSGALAELPPPRPRGGSSQTPWAGPERRSRARHSRASKRNRTEAVFAALQQSEAFDGKETTR